MAKDTIQKIPSEVVRNYAKEGLLFDGDQRSIAEMTVGGETVPVKTIYAEDNDVTIAVPRLDL